MNAKEWTEALELAQFAVEGEQFSVVTEDEHRTGRNQVEWDETQDWLDWLDKHDL